MLAWVSTDAFRLQPRYCQNTHHRAQECSALHQGSCTMTTWVCVFAFWAVFFLNLVVEVASIVLLDALLRLPRKSRPPNQLIGLRKLHATAIPSKGTPSTDVWKTLGPSRLVLEPNKQGIQSTAENPTYG